MAFRIEHRIGVAAPADTIWDLLADIEGWPRWNPLYTTAVGKLSIGTTLKLAEQLPGRPARQISPVVVDWEPLAQILWRESGLMSRVVRYIEIEILAETGCIFANGAFFHGLLGEAQAKSSRRPIFEGYQAMGETVKRLCEATWREQSAAG
jgi:hypothetical protein